MLIYSIIYVLFMYICITYVVFHAVVLYPWISRKEPGTPMSHMDGIGPHVPSSEDGCGCKPVPWQILGLPII